MGGAAGAALAGAVVMQKGVTGFTNAEFKRILYAGLFSGAFFGTMYAFCFVWVEGKVGQVRGWAWWVVIISFVCSAVAMGSTVLHSGAF